MKRKHHNPEQIIRKLCTSADGQWPKIHYQGLTEVVHKQWSYYGMHSARFTLGESICGVV